MKQKKIALTVQAEIEPTHTHNQAVVVLRQGGISLQKGVRWSESTDCGVRRLGRASNQCVQKLKRNAAERTHPTHASNSCVGLGHYIFTLVWMYSNKLFSFVTVTSLHSRFDLAK